MDKDNNILKQAKNYINEVAAKNAFEEIKVLVPMMVDTNKNVYDEMKKKGFTNEQAFSFSCQYTLKIMFNQQANEE